MSMNTTGLDTAVAALAKQEAVQAKAAEQNGKADKADRKNGNYGRTIGDPELSEEGKKYYEELKKKYSNMEFILVSSDMKEQANAQAGNYANPSKMVVLIDEEKVEKMASDQSFRKQYESVIDNAQSGLYQLKQKMNFTGAKVKGYGMKINDGGTATFFAVLKKSSAEQKARREKRAEERRTEKKAAEKKAQKEEQQEKLKSGQTDKSEHINDDFGDEDTITITAGSIEELVQKIEDYELDNRSSYVRTEEEKAIGQNIDYRW